LTDLPNDQPTTLLQYEAPPRPRSAPAWVWAVIAAYLMILVGCLIVPVWGVRDDTDLRVSVPLLLLPLLAAWFSLLLIPVKVMSRRTVTKRSLWVPLLGSGFLMGVLVAGAAAAMTEWLMGSIHHDFLPALSIGIGLLGWLCWGVVFWLISRARGAESTGMRLHRWLLAGSALELLIAVPTHVMVRRREECCAGLATGFGICFGLVVMFVAFGPSVALLYHKRAREITPKNRID
jgi:hypothetical protein